MGELFTSFIPIERRPKTESMLEAERLLPQLHAAQQRVVDEARRYNVLCCGRRFGKTQLGIVLVARTAMLGMPAVWFAPTYKSLAESWRDMKDYLAPMIRHKSETEHRLELHTDGVIECWSLEKSRDSGRGRKYARAVVDEAAMIPHMNEAWTGTILPTLADYSGDAWFLSTPRGMDFFAKAHAMGQDEHVPEWASWVMTTLDNPYILPEEVENLKSQMTERFFRQEIMAEFLDDAGGVFRGVGDVVEKGRSQNEPHVAGAKHFLGVDIARVQDFTVLTVMTRDGRQVYHERFNQISWERQVARIESVARAYGATVWMDSTGIGDPVFEAVRRRGIPVKGYQLTNSSKEALIDALAIAIEGRSVKLMDVPEQTTELRAYQYELTAARNVRMNAPEGMHDDCVIALALAWWPCSKPGAVYTLV